MSSTGGSKKEQESAVDIQPLKLPGLSVSTQASTLKTEPKKTKKEDKVYKVAESTNQTPLRGGIQVMKKTIDFKVLNLASLNNRFDHNISR
jgi:hypothetical protein